MNFVAPRNHDRWSSPLGRRGWGVVVGALLALALVAMAEGRLTTTHVPPPTDAAATPTAEAGAERPAMAPTPTPTTTDPLEKPAPDRVPSVLRGGAALPAPPLDRSMLARSEPVRVRIPAIGVDSELIGLGLQDDGRMEVPAGAFPAGWFTGAPTPGELGPAVLAGHVDYGGTAGVFSRLRDLRAGDAVEVARADGSTATFRVTRVEQHPKDAFPTAAVYGDIDHAGLRLITCGGSFDRRVHSYEDNIVVFAELVS